MSTIEAALELARSNPKEYLARFRHFTTPEVSKYFSLLSPEGFLTHLEAAWAVALASPWRQPLRMSATFEWGAGSPVELWGLELTYLEGSKEQNLWLLEAASLEAHAFDTLLAWSRKQLASRKLSAPVFRVASSRYGGYATAAWVGTHWEQTLQRFGPVTVRHMKLTSWDDTYDRGGLEYPAGASCSAQLVAGDGTQFNVDLGQVPRTEAAVLETWARETARTHGITLETTRP